MHITVGVLSDIVESVRSLGSSKIESSNLSLTIREDGRLMAGVASKSTSLVAETPVTIPANDVSYFTGAIAVRMAVLTKLLGELHKDDQIELTVKKNPNKFVQLLAPGEKYDLAYSELTKEEIASVFNMETSGVWLMQGESTEILSPLGKVISNMGALVVDNQVRTIMHRKKSHLTISFLTATVLPVLRIALQGTYPDDGLDYGIDTNTEFVPLVFLQILAKILDNTTVSVRYDMNVLSIVISRITDGITSTAVLKTAYKPKSVDLKGSLAGIMAMATIIENITSSRKVVKIGIEELYRMVKKGASVIYGGDKSKFAMYIPLLIVDGSKVRIDFKSPGGNYERTVDTNVTVEGFQAPVVAGVTEIVPFYNMNILMMTNILGTLSKLYPGARVIIDVRNDPQNSRAYVKISPETSETIAYYSRMTAK